MSFSQSKTYFLISAMHSIPIDAHWNVCFRFKSNFKEEHLIVFLCGIQLMLIGLYVLDSKVTLRMNISLFFCVVMPNCFSKRYVVGFDY